MSNKESKKIPFFDNKGKVIYLDSKTKVEDLVKRGISFKFTDKNEPQEDGWFTAQLDGFTDKNEPQEDGWFTAQLDGFTDKNEPQEDGWFTAQLDGL
jgi:hypothetical protein